MNYGVEWMGSSKKVKRWILKGARTVLREGVFGELGSVGLRGVERGRGEWVGKERAAGDEGGEGFTGERV